MVLKKISLAFLSAGLGHVSRGFETSAAIWFQSLLGKNNFDVRLFSGGNYSGATTVWNAPRNGIISSILRKFNLINDGCRLEQITFSLGFLVYLFWYRPTFIWLQEGTLGNMLLIYRRIFRFKYKIIFCDGAPVGPAFASKFDFLIFLHETALNEALLLGVNLEKCVIIPHLTFQPKSILKKKEARSILKINVNGFVIICVAAWNTHHKRIDYLLRETAQLNRKCITLLLCGQPEAGSEILKEMAVNLGLNVRWCTLTQDELSIAYTASDLFVLPSLSEGLGAVLIEAAFHNLPVIAHPHEGSKFILGESYKGLTDLSEPGALAKKIKSLIYNDITMGNGYDTAAIVNEKFSNDTLAKRFINFVNYAYSNQYNEKLT